MYYLVIIFINLISVQARWFFTYFPILIFSNLKVLELVNLFFKKNILIFIKKITNEKRDFNIIIHLFDLIRSK